MTGHSDDAKVMELLAPLIRLEPVPFAVAGSPERRPLLRRPVVVAAVLVVALAVAGVAIANGVGAFNAIGAAQRSQSDADVLDSRVARSCSSRPAATFYDPFCHLVPSSVRLISRLAGGRKIYVLTDTRGDLCVVDEARTITSSCGPPLSRSHPITGTFGNDSPTTGGDFVAGGVAVDGVAAVSFTVSGQDVTVPVKDNVWLYEQPDSHATGGSCIVVHFADGSTIDPFPEDPCARPPG